jgi:hypothetical protein
MADETHLYAKDDGGTYSPLGVCNNNGLLVAVASPITAFGEMSVAELQPVVQQSFIYNNNADAVNETTTGSGSITNANALCKVDTTAATSSSARLETVRFLKYRPGQGAIARWTAIFTTGVAGSEQHAGCFDDDNGYGFGYNGATFGLFSRTGGTDTWVAQTAWNVDKMDGTGPSGQTLDQTKGNVYQVQFQFLGFGAIVFSVEDASNGRITIVHKIQYPNTNTQPSVENPSFPLAVEVENTTNNTSISVQSASMFGGVEGYINKSIGLRFNYEFTGSVSNSAETHLLTIQSPTTFASKTSKVLMYPTFIAATSESKPAIIRLRKNSTFSTPTWTDVSSNKSAAKYMSAGTDNLDGAQSFSFGVGNSDSEGLDLLPIEIELAPGDTLSISGLTLTSSSSIIGSITWVEDQ